MSNTHYQIYVANVMMLANTLSIKSQDTADGLCTFQDDQAALNGTAATDYTNPRSWKYYLNISGEYHFLDTPMYVTSLDSLETILFSKANLAIHVATASAYRFGSRLYKVLVEQYPDQELLIKGILYPANIDDAIAAKDGTILAYPSDLVEPNEYSLIPKLQQWIYGYKIRWYNIQFRISDSLYPATSLAIMYLNIVPAIMNFRLEACKTNEAHSFHVKQYLLSHGLNNDQIDDMTLKQRLFFYRNINYILKNVGKQSTFEMLIKNVMTERNMPLAGFEMRHELGNVVNTNYPDIMFYKKPVNAVYDSTNVSQYTLAEFLAKERPCAPDNLTYEEDYLASTETLMKNSISNRLQTKLLENAMIDETNSTQFSFTEILLNELIDLSTKGIYKAYVSFNSPTSGELISLSVKDAFILAIYASFKTLGITLSHVPTVMATRVQRVVPNTNIVSLADLMSVVDPRLVPSSVGQQALSLQPHITDVISTKAFYDLCTKIYNATNMQRNLIAYQEHYVARGMVNNLVNRIYSDNVCVLSPTHETYANWLGNRSIDMSNFTANDFNHFYTSLIAKATGADLVVGNTLKDLQEAMVSIMVSLSSYSVQYITSINDTSEIKTDWTSPRLGDIKASSEGLVYPSISPLDVNNIAIGYNDSGTVRFRNGLRSAKTISGDALKINIGSGFKAETLISTESVIASIGSTNLNSFQ